MYPLLGRNTLNLMVCRFMMVCIDILPLGILGCIDKPSHTGTMKHTSWLCFLGIICCRRTRTCTLMSGCIWWQIMYFRTRADNRFVFIEQVMWSIS